MRDPQALREKLRGARGFFSRVTALGIKPLYYASSGGAFLFSSEVRSLLASGRLDPQLSPDSLEAYLTFGSVAEPSTLVEGVFSIPPGHCLSFSADAPPAKPSPKPYWVYSDAVLQQEGAKPKNIQGSRETVAPFAGRNRSRPPDLGRSTGHFSFERTGLHKPGGAGQPIPERSAHIHGDISRAALQRSQDFSRNGQAIQDAPSGSSPYPGTRCVAQLEDAVKSLDQPTMDGLNTYFVSRAAREAGLKVALSGLGSDEIFGGYSTFVSTPRAAFVAGLGRWISGSVPPPDCRRGRQDCLRRRGAQGCRGLAFPHGFSARVLFHAASVHSVSCAAPARPLFRIRRIFGQPRKSLARAYAGDRAAGWATRFLHRRFLFRIAVVHGEYAAARHRLRQHGQFSRGPRAISRPPPRGVRRPAAEEREIHARTFRSPC